MIGQFLVQLAEQLWVIVFRLGLAAVVIWLGLRLTHHAQFIARRMVRQARPDDPEVLETLFTRVLQAIGVTVSAIVALAFLGVDVSALVASLGLTSLALGFALRDVIEQAVTGTLLLLIRPFQIGDAIELNGIEGAVTAVSLRTTELRTSDGIHVLIPNNKVYQSVIRNKSHYPARRYELTMRFDYAIDIGSAQQVLLSAVRMASPVLADPPPTVSFESLDKATICASVRYWLPAAANTSEAHTTVVRALTEATRQAELPLTERIHLVMDE